MRKTMIKSIVMMVMGLMLAIPTYADGDKKQILIEMPSGETLTLEVDNYDYLFVSDVKNMIQERQRIPSDNQRLIYKRVLEDDKSEIVFMEDNMPLYHYGITDSGETPTETPTIRLVLRCCGTGIDNIFHEVTNATLDYYTTYTNGKLSDQLAEGSATPGTTVYVKATPDFGYTVKNMNIEAVESYASDGAQAPAFRAPGIGTPVSLTKVKDYLYSFTMPANGNDVSITASLHEKAKNTAAISYIDADGNSQSKAANTVYILDGTEESIGRPGRDYDNNISGLYETWYVCNTQVDDVTNDDVVGLCYNSKLTTYGNLNLILADGCKMTVNASEANDGALLAYGDLTIYGQTNGIGALSVRNVSASNEGAGTENANGIHTTGKLTIAGGYVTASSKNGDGIHCGSISICGGFVDASSETNDGIDSNNSLCIYGGQVTATTYGSTEDRHAGIRLSNDSDGAHITLGWRKPTDYIQASSYYLLNSSNRIKIEENLMMQYADATVTHKILGVISKNNNGTPEDPVDDFYPIDGKMLRPYGRGGYCGIKNQYNELGKNLIWEIPLNNDNSTPGLFSQEMTIEGEGAMTKSGETAPWNNYKYPYSSINVRATGALSLRYITENTPVTLHFLGDIPSDCQERYIVTTCNGENNESVWVNQYNNVFSFNMPASGAADITPAIAISFADGETWRTWCDHNTWTLPDGSIEVYTISSMSANGQLTLTPVHEPLTTEPWNEPRTIPAGTPLLLQKVGDNLVAAYDSDAASNSLVSSDITDGDNNTVATLWGNPTNTAITEGDFTESGLTAYNFYRGAFVRVENSQEVGAHHCLLTTSSAITPQSLAISGLTGSSDQFGHITYTGTAANDGGALKFFSDVKDAQAGKNAITLTNGQSTGPTDLTNILVPNGDNPINVGKGFFIMATPSVGHRLPNTEVGATVSFIKAEVVTTNNSVQQAPRRTSEAPTLEVGQTLPVKFYGYYSGWAPSDPATDYYGLYYVVMPADENLSVSITATFPGVATNTESISYVDDDGETHSKAAGTVYVLDGTEARLGYGSYNNRTEHETWYVLPDDLTYTNGLELYGKVHLILADGKTMSYNGDENFIYSFGNLDIYGQGGQQEGAISAKTTAEQCIYFTGDVTINGGNVSGESTHEATNYFYGITNEGTLTINGGTVSGKSESGGIYGGIFKINGGTVNGTGTNYCGITEGDHSTITITGGHVCGVGGSIGIRGGNALIITGGQIEATGTTGEDAVGLSCAYSDIILGWTNPDDYIKANGFRCSNYQTTGKVVKTADGKALKYTDGENTVKLTGKITDLDAIKNQKLTPYGIWGYCGKDDAETTNVDESKNLTWDIPLATNATGADQLGTTLTIQGNGEMVDHSYNEGDDIYAPWIKRKTINTEAGEYYEPDGLKYPSVTNVVIADGVASIGASAFESCTGIQSVSLGGDVAFIDNYAFKGCTGIQSITFPASVGTINSRAFEDCTNLTTVTIERDGSDHQYPTTFANDDAFIGCNKLTVIYIPNEAVYSVYNSLAGTEHYWDSEVGGYSLLERFAPLTFTVTKNKSGWGTYCHDYPVSYSMSDGNEGDKAPKAYTVSGLGTDGKSVTLGNASATVAPITPLLLNYTAPDNDDATDDETITFTALPETATTDAYDYYPVINNGYGTDVIFYGNTSNTTQKHDPNATDSEGTIIDDGIPALTGVSGTAFYGLYNGEFVLIDTDNGIPAHRCVLAVSNGTDAPVLTIGEGTTNITTTNYTNFTNSDGAWYSLDGRKLDKQPTAKGIYINGGRKVVIK